MTTVNISQELVIQVIAQIPVIIGFTWSIASEKNKLEQRINQVEFNLERAIDNVNDTHSTILNSIDKRLDLHIQSSITARESLNERLQGQGKRFGSKFERLERRVDEVLNLNVIIEKLNRMEQEH